MAMSAYNDTHKYGLTMLFTSLTALANSTTLPPIMAALRLLEGNKRKDTTDENSVANASDFSCRGLAKRRIAVVPRSFLKSKAATRSCRVRKKNLDMVLRDHMVYGGTDVPEAIPSNLTFTVPGIQVM